MSGRGRRQKASQFILEDRLTPPTYQIELLCSALNNNTVLCVSNDNGVSFIPIMLIKLMTERQRTKKVLYISVDGTEGYRSCKQNEKSLHTHSSLNVLTILSSDKIADVSVLDNVNVLSIQADICLSLLQSGVLDLGDISLMVLDDCHVAVDANSSYSQIVSMLNASQQFNDVRIFGMTSSIIGGLLEEPEELEIRITQLEHVLNARAETMTNFNSMDSPQTRREEIIEIYRADGNSEKPDKCDGGGEEITDCALEEARLLTETIRVTLQHAYHFLADMIIAQTDVVTSRTSMIVKKSRTKASSEFIAATESVPQVSEPAKDSTEWSHMQMLKDIPRKVFTEVETTLDELGAWCAGCVALNLCSTLEKLIDKSTEKFEKLLLQLAFTHLKYIHTLVQQASERIMDHTELLAMSTPKVRKLIEILKSYLPKVDFEITSAVTALNKALSGGGGKDLNSEEDYSDFSDLSDGDQEQEPVTVAKIKQQTHEKKDKLVKVNQEETTLNGLVFVERKHTAFALHKYIEELCIWDCDMYFIRSSFMIGSTESEDGKEDELKTKKQEQRLTQFRQHKVNLLVGTSVLESNIDLPKCNLVAMFDPPQSYTSYIKTKSRAQSFKAKYYTICSQDQKLFFTKCMENFNKIEMILQSKCQELGQSISHTESADIMECSGTDYVLPDPFVSPKTGATVTMDNSIALLNRYCAKLPSDIYTRLTPTSTVTQASCGGYQATIKLPINCRLKQSITGDVMKTEQLAISAAALKTCVALYNHGELDANLAPIGKEYLRNAKQDAEWEKEGYNKNSKGLPGSSKRKQYYDKRTSEVLKEAILPETACFLYTADLKLAITMDQQKHNKGREVFRTEDYPYTVGLITRQQLPPVAEFPVFTRSGQESVKLELTGQKIFTQQQFDRLTAYHMFVFHNVLRIDKFPLKFSANQSEFNILVIPCIKDAIAWDYLDRTLEKMVEWTNRPPLFSRKSETFVFHEDHFKDAVVVPTYRNQDQPEFFYVASIRKDLNPDAPFPSPDLYESFYSYYTSKYGLSITNKTQPLLDVDRTSGRLNLMTPRYMNQKGMPLPTSSHSKKTKKISIRERQILIPELCDIHPCSASMWRKLVCVPTILHRINSLLLSYELLCSINSGMKLGLSTEHLVPVDDKLDLGVDISLLQAPPIPTPDKPTPAHLNVESQSDVIDTQSFANELQESMKETLTITDDVPSQHTDTQHTDTQHSDTHTGLEVDESDDDMSSDTDSDSDSDDSDTVDMTNDISSDLQLDKEENSLGGSGPTASMILHAVTMSNASDFINLERLETVGDSFLKFAVTLYLFCTHAGLHEGRLSYGRGKQVFSNSSVFDRVFNEIQDVELYIRSTINLDYENESLQLQEIILSKRDWRKKVTEYHHKHPHHKVSNFNLYSLGRKLGLQEYLISDKFEPTENWLPPGYIIADDYEPMQEFKAETQQNQKGGSSKSGGESGKESAHKSSSQSSKQNNITIPYNLRTQHSIPDKAIADCVESLIGCYLTSCGPYSARVFMAWLGINVLPRGSEEEFEYNNERADSTTSSDLYTLPKPPSALLTDTTESHLQLECLFSGLESLEESLNYKFSDKAYLVQAFTHASYIQNTVTDCYQRLEFLGDAVLDYVITRRLFEDNRKHSPGILTDLRSALVNNNVFAALAVKWNLHKYIKYNSTQLYKSVDRFVQHQKSRNDRIQVEQYLRLSDEEDDDSEEVEIPKVLGDIFESVAGAVYLDSNMSLDTVWRVFYPLMIQQIVKFSKHIPKSPVRELLEREPETAKFQRPERTKDGRVRVSVTVAGKDTWWGVGRSYRIAKSAAAKKALIALNSNE